MIKNKLILTRWLFIVFQILVFTILLNETWAQNENAEKLKGKTDAIEFKQRFKKIPTGKVPFSTITNASSENKFKAKAKKILSIKYPISTNTNPSLKNESTAIYAGTGTIRYIGNKDRIYYISIDNLNIIPTNNYKNPYNVWAFDPIYLPEEFKKKGLKIIFIVKPRPDIYKTSIQSGQMAPGIKVEIIEIEIAPIIEVEGFYSQGFEVSEFIPKGINEKWWVEKSIPGFYEKYESIAQSSYEAVYVKVRGIKSELGKYGHCGAYNRSFTLEELIEMRKALPYEEIIDKAYIIAMVDITNITDFSEYNILSPYYKEVTASNIKTFKGVVDKQFKFLVTAGASTLIKEGNYLVFLRKNKYGLECDGWPFIRPIKGSKVEWTKTDFNTPSTFEMLELHEVIDEITKILKI